MLVRVFFSLPGLSVSSEDSIPIPPPWPPQMGHMPRRVPREAWGRESPQDLGQIWVGQGLGEVTRAGDVLEPQVGQGLWVSINTHTNSEGSPGT